MTSGTLTLVATPIGNLSDISPRAVEALQAADVVCCEDTRRTGMLLQHLGISGKKYIVINEHTEFDACDEVVGKLLGGIEVALVSDAGTPGISDPGERLVKAAVLAGITVSSIPGPSALTMALVMSGLSTSRFVFEGFLPAKAGARQARLQELAKERRTLVFYEAPHRIVECLADMEACFGSERAATLARELTKTYETIIPATLGKLIERVRSDENQQKGEIVLVVGGCAASEGALDADAEKTLKILLEELPLRQAASLAAKITGLKKNLLYDTALSWQEIKD